MSLATLGIASVQRSADIAQINHNEYNKVAQQQVGVQKIIEKESDERSESVNQKEDVSMEPGKFDARDKSSNEYFADREKKEKKKKKTDGQVKIKGQSGFDIKI